MVLVDFAEFGRWSELRAGLQQGRTVYKTNYWVRDGWAVSNAIVGFEALMDVVTYGRMGNLTLILVLLRWGL